MSAESVGSCVGGRGAPPKLPLPNPRCPFREEQKFSPNTPDKSYNKSTICYHCKQEEHWARECPNKSMESPGPSPGKTLLPKRPPNYPELLCKSCQQPCVVRTSHTAANPERDFYTCPGQGACEHFEFVDSPIDITKKVPAGMNIRTSNPGATKVNDNTVVLPASPRLGGIVAANHVGSGSTGVKSPDSPEESPSKCKCVNEWKNEYIVSPTFSGYVAANELDIRYDDLLDEEAKSPQMDKGGVDEHIHIESEETIAPKSPVLPRSLKNTRVPYSPIRMLSFTEDSPRNPTCLVCGGSHETEECIPLELLQEWSLEAI